MGRQRNDIMDAIHASGVVISRMDRKIVNIWNKNRTKADVRTFCGFYWNRSTGGFVVSNDSNGPFPCYSAAAADAYKKLQLSYYKRKPGR